MRRTDRCFGHGARTPRGGWQGLRGVENCRLVQWDKGAGGGGGLPSPTSSGPPHRRPQHRMAQQVSTPRVPNRRRSLPKRRPRPRNALQRQRIPTAARPGPSLQTSPHRRRAVPQGPTWAFDGSGTLTGGPLGRCGRRHINICPVSVLSALQQRTGLALAHRFCRVDTVGLLSTSVKPTVVHPPPLGCCFGLLFRVFSPPSNLP